MEIFDGYLFSKLHLIGTESEGPLYFLQQWDYTEPVVMKKTPLWEIDPELHSFLNRKVTIEGDLGPHGIEYQKISDFVLREKRETEHLLELELGTDVLWIDKMPVPKLPRQSMDLTLRVQWPARSIWHGQCPTSQLFDFWIERKGEIFWRWSEGKIFQQVITPVTLIGGRWYEYPVLWDVDPDKIEVEGTYTAHAVFIACGREVTNHFEIKFAHFEVGVGEAVLV